MEEFIEETITFLSNVKINTVFETLAAILTLLIALVGAISWVRKHLFKIKRQLLPSAIMDRDSHRNFPRKYSSPINTRSVNYPEINMAPVWDYI